MNDPATSSDLAKLAAMFDGVVPPELEQFYRLANGMMEFATDGWHLSFWSIDLVLRERDVVVEGSTKWVAFADFLIYSRCIRVGTLGANLFVSIDGGPERYPSLEAFFDRYRSHPEAFGLREPG